ncbi:hypothetical protein PG989_012759 [Apiospora arundinis]
MLIMEMKFCLMTTANYGINWPCPHQISHVICLPHPVREAQAQSRKVKMASAPTENTLPVPAGNTTTNNNDAQVAEEDEEVNPEPQEAKMPTRRDISLKEFLNKMDDYAPIIPDAVTNYYMTRAGLPPPPQTDQRLARLLALATQKFVADIAADAYQYSRIRASNTSANNPMGNLGAAAGIPIPGQAAGGGGGGAGAGSKGGSQNRTVLTMEDLGMAVGEYGVNVKRSEFYR